MYIFLMSVSTFTIVWLNSIRDLKNAYILLPDEIGILRSKCENQNLYCELISIAVEIHQYL